jgi:hypothetical protein
MMMLRLCVPAATVAAVLLTAAMLAAGTANADDYAGKTYSDASSALKDANLK